jgi:hypothetical protein
MFVRFEHLTVVLLEIQFWYVTFCFGVHSSWYFIVSSQKLRIETL